MKNQQSNIVAIDINAVKSRMLQVRGQQVLLDRDVAALYGVATRIINQAVKNNPEKFPTGYVAECQSESGQTGTNEPAWDVNYEEYTDGTITWKMRKIGSGSGGGGRVLGDIVWRSAENPAAVGELLADGAEISRSMYPDLNELYAAAGYPWGDGDGSTTFNLPNLIRKFPEGADVAGGYHDPGLPNITGTGYDADGEAASITAVWSGAFSADLLLPSAYGWNSTGGSQGVSSISFDASRSSDVYGNSDTVQPPSALLLPYVVVFTEATPDSALVDMTQYDQDLAKKANRDLSNLTPTGQAKLGTTVVESYHDDQGNWWRKYSDGWIEQGGIIGRGPETSIVTISYNKPFTSANVVLITNTKDYAGTEAVTYTYSCPKNVTATGFNKALSSSTEFVWYACGQGANI